MRGREQQGTKGLAHAPEIHLFTNKLGATVPG
jgi:hypothetical protein